MFALTLIFANSSEHVVGGFSSMDELNAWIAKEQQKEYWNNVSTYSIKDNTPIKELIQ